MNSDVLPSGISRQRLLDIAARHGAKNVRVFGSFARQEARPDSDLDLLVELESDRDLFDIVALKQELERVLDRKVDVLTEGALSRYIREDVVRDAVPL